MSKFRRGLAPALLSASLCAGLFLHAGEAAAQAGSDARARFDEGMKLMRDNDFRSACKKFKESQQLRSLMTTKFRLAECYELTERLSGAWRLFTEVGEQAELEGLPDRAKFARQRAQVIEPKLSKLTVVVAPALAQLDGLKVTLDGEPLDGAAFGTAKRVDPGGHVVDAIAPGYQKWSKATYVAGEAQELVVEIPILTAIGAQPVSEPPVEPDQPESVSSSLGTYQIAAIVLGGVGVVAMGAGVGLGVAADGKHQDAADRCLPQGCAQPELDEQDSAVTLGNVGTAVFFVGIASIATGAVLWFVAPDEDPQGGEASTARLGISPAGAGARLHLSW